VLLLEMKSMMPIWLVRLPLLQRSPFAYLGPVRPKKELGRHRPKTRGWADGGPKECWADIVPIYIIFCFGLDPT
jgi:hypothetical protein